MWSEHIIVSIWLDPLRYVGISLLSRLNCVSLSKHWWLSCSIIPFFFRTDSLKSAIRMISLPLICNFLMWFIRSLIAVFLGWEFLLLFLLLIIHCWCAAVLSLLGVICVLHTIYAVMIEISKFGGPIVMVDHLPSGWSFSFSLIWFVIFPLVMMAVPPGLYSLDHVTDASEVYRWALCYFYETRRTLPLMIFFYA